MTVETERIRDKLEALEIKKRKLSDKLVREKARLKAQERKQRTRRLIEIGGLAEIAEISFLDKGAVLGAMLEVAHLLKDKPTFAMLKSKGDSTLLERTIARKRNSSSDRG